MTKLLKIQFVLNQPVVAVADGETLSIDYPKWRALSDEQRGTLLGIYSARAEVTSEVLTGKQLFNEMAEEAISETAEEFVNNLEGQVADLNEKLRQRTMQVEAQAATIKKVAEDFLAQSNKLQELDRLNGILRAEREELRASLDKSDAECVRLEDKIEELQSEVHTLKDNMGKIGSCMRNISSSIDDIQGEIDAVEGMVE